MAASIQTSTTDTAATTKHPSKRRKLTTDQHQNHQEQPLIPGLPDHVASNLPLPCPPLYTLHCLPPMASPNLLPFFPSFSISLRSFIINKPSAPSPNPPPLLHLPSPPYPIHLCFWRLEPWPPTQHTSPLVCCRAQHTTPVYVASGIGSQFNTGVARSAEKWDLESKNVGISTVSNKTITWKWKRVKELKDGRFCRDAIDAVGWRGKLCMVNVKGDAPKEGISYDTKKDAWENMPEGMLAGWRGPVASMDEETMFVVDEAKGVLRKYDPEKDYWEHMMESERLVGAQKIAAGGGRVCAICGCSTEIVVLDVAALPVKLWVVKTPPGLEALAIHILPRMTRPDF
uniref:Uncharacterized protein n=1 Tax=Salix viminalis TaxID=40686 RepID=A0A6N2KKY8_SALVM